MSDAPDLLQSLDALKIASYRFELQCLTSVDLGGFPGDTLRSALGLILARLNCQQHPTCAKECEQPDHCAFGQIIQSRRGASNVPQPFVLGLEWRLATYAPSSTLLVDIHLFGQDHLETFVEAFRGLEKTGLVTRHGNHGKTRLQAVVNKTPGHEGEIVYQHDASCGAPVRTPIATLISPDFSGEAPAKLTLHLISPLRLVDRDNRPSRQLQMIDLIRSLHSRTKSLAKFHCNANLPLPRQELFDAAAKVHAKNTVRWQEQTRKDVNWGGMMGQVEFEGDMELLYPLLQIGTLTHTGKGTSMGLGAFAMEF